MLFLDMLIALLVIAYLTVGSQPMSMFEIVLALMVGVGVIVVVHLSVSWAIDQLVGGWYVQKDSNLSSRRRVMKGEVFKNRAERSLEAMDDDELQTHLKRRPRDAAAAEVLYERLRRAGRWTDYAREMEYLLTLETGLTVEEQCSRYHELADLYLNRLGRPDRARELLRTLIATYPKHYEATLARRRLEKIDQQPA